MSLTYNIADFKKGRKAIRAHLHKKSGVYSFYAWGHCLYVGASTNLFMRSFRIYRTPQKETILLREFVRRVGGWHIVEVRIYLCEEAKLKEMEHKKTVELNPLSQMFLSYRDYPKGRSK